MSTFEIERKFIVKKIPTNLEGYCSHYIEQAYLCSEPVVRIRREDNDFYLTYKSKGLLKREEYNLPLTPESYFHLKEKADGKIITKRRYFIPLSDTQLTVELDVFEDNYKGLILAEVEFSSVEEADCFLVPDWFSKEVTYDKNYHNSNLSRGNLDII